MKSEITTYYNNLATTYDQNRFKNSYGNYIHLQENAILKKYLPSNITENLDIACGTGRFLNFSDYGVDISENMVNFSKKKYPTKNIQIADAEHLPFEPAFFNHVTSFHLMMHLNMVIFESILNEVHRVIKKNGLFIFDIPSEKRRKLTHYQAENWHGGNQADLKHIQKIIGSKWEVVSYYGIAFFPIHHIPNKLRKHFIKLDNFIGKSTFKSYSSHLIFILKKK